MARSRVELDPAFRRMLQQLPDQVTAELKTVISDSVDAVYAEALRHIPVDTGDLAHALGRRIGSNGLSGEVGYSRKRFPRQWRSAGWRARWVEFGTKGSIKHKLKPRAPHPFLGPAFAINRQWILDRHREAVERVLKRAGAT